MHLSVETRELNNRHLVSPRDDQPFAAGDGGWVEISSINGDIAGPEGLKGW